MNIPWILKLILLSIALPAIIIGGAVAYFALKSGQVSTTDLSKTHEKVKSAITENETKQLDSVKKFISKNTPEIVNNPVLAPIVNTQKELNSTVDTIKSLPEDQKNAICTQICGN
ncbi:MAG: hypothetical protein AAB599_01855 [Patescibacteria group bacterium]